MIVLQKWIGSFGIWHIKDQHFPQIVYNYIYLKNNALLIHLPMLQILPSHETDCVGRIYWKWPSSHTSRSWRGWYWWISLSHALQIYRKTPHCLHLSTASFSLHLQHSIAKVGGANEATVLLNILSLTLSQFSSRFSILFCHAAGPVSNSPTTERQSSRMAARSENK